MRSFSYIYRTEVSAQDKTIAIPAEDCSSATCGLLTTTLTLLVQLPRLSGQSTLGWVLLVLNLFYFTVIGATVWKHSELWKVVLYLCPDLNLATALSQSSMDSWFGFYPDIQHVGLCINRYLYFKQAILQAKQVGESCGWVLSTVFASQQFCRGTEGRDE